MHGLNLESMIRIFVANFGNLMFRISTDFSGQYETAVYVLQSTTAMNVAVRQLRTAIVAV